MELQSELWHALDILINEHEDVEMSSQSNAKSIVTYVEVGKSKMFKSTFVNQLKCNATLSFEWLEFKLHIIYET